MLTIFTRETQSKREKEKREQSWMLTRTDKTTIYRVVRILCSAIISSPWAHEERVNTFFGRTNHIRPMSEISGDVTIFALVTAFVRLSTWALFHTYIRKNDVSFSTRPIITILIHTIHRHETHTSPPCERLWPTPTLSFTGFCPAHPSYPALPPSSSSSPSPTS